MHEERIDADLVLAAREGDTDALSAIYDRYADRLHDFCHSVLRDRHEAADAMQDTFVLAAQRLDQLRDPAKLRAWLFAIARHESIRRGKARARMAPTEDVGVDGALDEPPPEVRMSVDTVQETVWAAAAGLAERDRALLDLHLRQGLDGQELAAAIGVSPGHAYVLMNRLRERVERSIGALLVARQGSKECPDLTRILADWDGTFTPLWRKRVARHVDGCEVCQRQRKSMLSPLAALGAVPLVPAPRLLRDRTVARMREARSPAAPRIEGWRRPGAREGFPPGIGHETARTLAIVGTAAAAGLLALGVWFVVDAAGGAEREVERVVSDVDDVRGRGGGDDRRDEPGPTTTSAPASGGELTATTAPPPSGGASQAGVPTPADEPVPVPVPEPEPGPAPPPPPPDTSGPQITGLWVQMSCIDNWNDLNNMTATVTDPSGVASVTVTVVSSGEGTVYDGPMSGGGSSYEVVVGPWSSLGTVTWTVHALDALGNAASRAGPSFEIATFCP